MMGEEDDRFLNEGRGVRIPKRRVFMDTWRGMQRNVSVKTREAQRGREGGREGCMNEENVRMKKREAH